VTEGIKNTAGTRTVACVVSALLLVATGCATWGPATETSMQNLRTKASFDLNCPANELQIIHISGQCGTTSYNMCTKGITGCGHRASYLYLSGGSWRLESASTLGSGAE
jgi:hypothetical protein